MGRKRVWDEHNLQSTEGVEALERRGPDQQGPYTPVDPQPKVMIVVVDEADPHANERNSYSGQYGVLYCLREDNVQDKDRFWYQPHLDGQPVGQRFIWGVVGAERWNINHALTGTNFGVKQFRIRRGG
jgi:hypothetical protein